MSKKQVTNVQTLPIAGAATYLSQPMNVATLDIIGYAVRAAAGPIGPCTVLYSNDFAPVPAGNTGNDQPNDLTKWDTYTAVTPPSLSGAGQKFGILLDWYEFQWVRLQFVISGGSGNIIIAYDGKGY